MDDITFTPGAKLRFCKSSGSWQQDLLDLAVDKRGSKDPLPAYWRKFATACLTAIAHAANPDAPTAAEGETLKNMEPDDLTPFLDHVPLMKGAEYINQDRLYSLWRDFMLWCGQQIKAAGGITPFFTAFAPQWNEVGRIFFHLGENRADSEKPFAFLATYTRGFDEQGRLRHTPLVKALQVYSDSRADLARLLTPVSAAAAKVPWVRSLWESRAIYKAMAWKPAQAHQFLKSANELEDCGIGIRLPDWWKKRPRVQVRASLSVRSGAKLGLNSLLDCDLALALGDMELDPREAEQLLAADGDGLVLVKNQWVEVDRTQLSAALAHWRQVQRLARSGKLDFIQGMRLLAGIDEFNTDSCDETTVRQWSAIRPDALMQDMLDQARNIKAPETIAGLNATLRPYQLEGVRWLQFLGRLGLGACLADDMGLGKTIQVISLLLCEKEDKPGLLIVPASLITNWEQECGRFAPDLRLLILHPARMKADDMNESGLKARLAECDLVITSYGLAKRLAWLADLDWSRIILDEAQNIKNRGTKQSIAVRKLRAPVRIALTGTPIENSLMDLWTLFDFINPGLMSSADAFAKLAKKLQKSDAGIAPLRKLAAPYILRRMKTDKTIISSLPEKTEVPLYCNLTARQAALYKRTVEKLASAMQKAAEADKKDRNMLVLQNLMRLKQICNHPGQAGVMEESDFSPASSGKFLRVGELCAEIASRQEKVLVFTQFREIIKPLASHLAHVFGEPGLILHGNTPMKSRGALVEKFQHDDGPPFFILSLKAGGTGLNLTQASHVIHFDRWWNPAVENQATDRAFRIGQKKNVLVHKCVTLGTLEEKIDALIESKKSMAADIMDDISASLISMTDEQILAVVRLDATSLEQ